MNLFQTIEIVFNRNWKSQFSSRNVHPNCRSRRISRVEQLSSDFCFCKITIRFCWVLCNIQKRRLHWNQCQISSILSKKSERNSSLQGNFFCFKSRGYDLKSQVWCEKSVDIINNSTCDFYSSCFCVCYLLVFSMWVF